MSLSKIWSKTNVQTQGGEGLGHLKGKEFGLPAVVADPAEK